MPNSPFGLLNTPDQPHTITIIGGGLAGTVCALALAKSGHTVYLHADLVSVKDAGNNPTSDRPLALSQTSLTILANLLSISTTDVLYHLHATDIRHIHISEQGHVNRLQLNAKDQSQDRFGAVVSAHALLQYIESSLSQTSGVFVSEPSAPVDHDSDLTIYADGAQSPHREALGIDSIVQNYEESAVTGLIHVSTPLEHTAFERFTQDGPLAILPFGYQQYAFVLTLRPDREPDKTKPDYNESIRAIIMERIGYRLGAIEDLTIYGQFPLALRYSPRLCTDQHLLLGNSALSMHPIAGQGYNLVLKDIAWITELLSEEVSVANALAKYQSTRGTDHQLTREFTHQLVSAFDITALWPLRGVGLGLVNWSPSLQRLIAHLGGGRLARQPKLSYKTS